MIDLRKETIPLSEAREQLHDAIWPGAQYQLGTLDKSKTRKDPETGQLVAGEFEGYSLNLLEDRMAEIDNEVLAALRRDELCIRYEHGGMWRYFGPDHWRSMEDQSALVLLSLGRWTISENGTPRDLPMTLVRKEFEHFKRHVMDGNPARLVDLSDALAFIASGTANEAAAMRWRCELKHVHGRTDWVITHSEQFELALRDLHKSWRAGAALPIAQRPDKPGYDETVPAELADVCELTPYGPGQGKIEPKDVHDRLKGREWNNVRFQYAHVAQLCSMGGASVAPSGADSTINGRKQWSSRRVEKWLIDYRRALGNARPLPAPKLRSECETKLGYPAGTIGKNSFGDLMRKVDEDASMIGLPSIRRGVGRRD